MKKGTREGVWDALSNLTLLDAGVLQHLAKGGALLDDRRIVSSA